MIYNLIKSIQFILIIQYLILPRISEKLYYKKFNFDHDFLCNLMNTDPKNRKAKLIYQASSILFSVFYLSILIYNPSKYTLNLVEIIYILFFSLFFILQIIFHGQNNQNGLMVHCFMLWLCFFFNLLFYFSIYMKSRNIFYLIHFTIIFLNYLMTLFNINFEGGKKTKISIISGKIAYLSIILISIYFLI